MEYPVKFRLAPALTAVLAVVLLLVSACSDDSEAEPNVTNPDIRGAISSRSDGDGPTFSILIEGTIDADTTYDKASVRIDEDTAIYRHEGDDLVEAAASDLTSGTTVEAWFEGPVAESYPVQAYARQVVITG